MSASQGAKGGFLAQKCIKTKKEPYTNPLLGFMYDSYEFRHKKTGHPVSAFLKNYFIMAQRLVVVRTS